MRVRVNAFLCVPAAQAMCMLTTVVVAATAASTPNCAPRAATHFTTGAVQPMGAWRSTWVVGTRRRLEKELTGTAEIIEARRNHVAGPTEGVESRFSHVLHTARTRAAACGPRWFVAC